MAQLSFEQVKELVLAKYKQDAVDQEGYEMYKHRIAKANFLRDIALFLEDDVMAGMLYILDAILDYPEKEKDFEKMDYLIQKD